MAERIPGAERVIYKNSQHGVIIQKEENVLKRVIEFLKK